MVSNPFQDDESFSKLEIDLCLKFLEVKGFKTHPPEPSMDFWCIMNADYHYHTRSALDSDFFSEFKRLLQENNLGEAWETFKDNPNG